MSQKIPLQLYAQKNSLCLPQKLKNIKEFMQFRRSKSRPSLDHLAIVICLWLSDQVTMSNPRYYQKLIL